MHNQVLCVLINAHTDLHVAFIVNIHNASFDRARISCNVVFWRGSQGCAMMRCGIVWIYWRTHGTWNIQTEQRSVNVHNCGFAIKNLLDFRANFENQLYKETLK